MEKPKELETEVEDTAADGILRGTNTDVLLSRSIKPGTLDKLIEYRYRRVIKKDAPSIIDYLAGEYYQKGKSIRQISREAKVDCETILRIFRIYNFPVMSRVEAVKKRLEEKWKDLEYRKIRSQKVSEDWKDSDYRRRHIEFMKKRWEDKGYRKKQNKALKKGGEVFVDSDINYHEDLERITYSTVEANLERAIRHSERKYEIRRWFHDSQIKNNTYYRTKIYFLTTDPRGNKKAYVLVTKPSYKSYKKKEELERQGIKVRFMTKRFYDHLKGLIERKDRKNRKLPPSKKFVKLLRSHTL